MIPFKCSYDTPLRQPNNGWVDLYRDWRHARYDLTARGELFPRPHGLAHINVPAWAAWYVADGKLRAEWMN